MHRRSRTEESAVSEWSGTLECNDDFDADGRSEVIVRGESGISRLEVLRPSTGVSATATRNSSGRSVVEVECASALVGAPLPVRLKWGGTTVNAVLVFASDKVGGR